jgi:hypothetical protein
VTQFSSAVNNRWTNDLRVEVQALGWQSGGRCRRLHDDIASRRCSTSTDRAHGDPLVNNCRRTGQCLEAGELPIAAWDRGVGERADLADVLAHPCGSMVDAAV